MESRDNTDIPVQPDDDVFPSVLSIRDEEPANAGIVEISSGEFTNAIVSQDLKGRVSLRVPEAIEHELQSIAEDPAYPLNSPSEVVRFCLNSGIFRLRNWEPRPTLLGALRKTQALLSRDRIQAESSEMLNQLDDRVYWYIEHGEFDQAITFIFELKSYFEGIQDDFWKEYNLQAIDTKYAEWEQAIFTAQAAEEAEKASE